MPLATALRKAIQAEAPGTYPDPSLNAYVTKGCGWIIGPYDELCDVAHEIAPGTAMWAKFKAAGAKLCRRGTDQPPFVVGHLPGSRKKIAGKAPAAVPQSVRANRADPTQRTIGTRGRDQFKEMDAYYLHKGLESHHIVEKSILGRLGVNTGELADICAPCVLAMADLKAIAEVIIAEAKTRKGP